VGGIVSTRAPSATIILRRLFIHPPSRRPLCSIMPRAADCEVMKGVVFMLGHRPLNWEPVLNDQKWPYPVPHSRPPVFQIAADGGRQCQSVPQVSAKLPLVRGGTRPIAVGRHSQQRSFNV
jgi:hypothetical protein